MYITPICEYEASDEIEGLLRLRGARRQRLVLGQRSQAGPPVGTDGGIAALPDAGNGASSWEMRAVS